AALVAENRMVAHPCVIDTVPTSANQEDHVSMATHGARRLLDMAGNTAAVVGIELLAAAQGLEFHRPLKTSPQLETVFSLVREAAAAYGSDHYFAPDIARATDGVRAGRYRVFAGDLLPSWSAPQGCPRRDPLFDDERQTVDAGVVLVQAVGGDRIAAAARRDPGDGGIGAAQTVVVGLDQVVAGGAVVQRQKGVEIPGEHADGDLLSRPDIETVAVEIGAIAEDGIALAQSSFHLTRSGPEVLRPHLRRGPPARSAGGAARQGRSRRRRESQTASGQNADQSNHSFPRGLMREPERASCLAQ